MAQTGYTPIQLYYSSTTTNVPLAGNLSAGELAINTADGKLFYKDSGGTVRTLVSAGATPPAGSNTQLQFNNSGAFGASANLTWNGSTLFVGAGTALGGTTNPIEGALGSANNYIQSYIFNASNGVNASSDFVAYPDNGTDSSGWADMGVTSSAFSQAAYSVTGANEGYFFVSAPSGASKTGNMVLATDSTGTSNAIQFYTGGFNKSKSAYAAQIDGNGVLSIGGASVASNGLLQVLGVTSLQTVIEKTTVTATAAASTINFDLSTQADLYYTSNASANFTLNFRGASGTTLNTLMQTGQTVTCVFRNTNGSTAYYANAFTVDGTSVTPKWQGGTAPTSGNASSVDVYTFAITKTGSATFSVFASQSKFA
jgi:hypothetical protein